MKFSLNIDAYSINVLALNKRRIAVDIDGIKLSDLIHVVRDNGYTLRVADKPGKLIVEDPLPATARLAGIQCGTAHITDKDNQRLHTLSQLRHDHGDAEWIAYTGSGYLIRLDAQCFPVLQLKRRGLSKPCRRLIITLMRRYNITLIHFDAFAPLQPDFTTFDW